MDKNTHLKLQTRLDLPNCCIWLETTTLWKPHRNFLRELVHNSEVLKVWYCTKNGCVFHTFFPSPYLYTHSSTIWNCFFSLITCNWKNLNSVKKLFWPFHHKLWDQFRSLTRPWKCTDISENIHRWQNLAFQELTSVDNT